MSQRAAFVRFLAGQRAAEARALQLVREEGARSPEEAFSSALELFDLGSEDAADPLRERDDLQARATWGKLRAWAAGRVTQS